MFQSLPGETHKNKSSQNSSQVCSEALLSAGCSVSKLSLKKAEAEEYSMKPWLREDTGSKLVWHPQPLMNGTTLWVLWAPTQLRRDCFWTGAEPKQTREHQLRPPPACYTFNAPVVRNNPLCLTPPLAAAQHGTYMQYAAAQDRAGAPVETRSGLTGQQA